MAAGDTYELTLKGVCQGQLIVNTHYLRASAAGDQSEHMADTWNTSLGSLWAAMHTTDYALQTISSRQINPPGPVAYERAPTVSAGSNGAGSGTLTAASVIKCTTAFIGRSRRGRNFIGPLPGSYVVAGSLAAAHVTACNAYYNALLGLWGASGSDSANARWVVWSRHIAATISQDPPPDMGLPSSASAYVVAFHVDPIARVLRRRELGVGS